MKLPRRLKNESRKDAYHRQKRNWWMTTSSLALCWIVFPLSYCVFSVDHVGALQDGEEISGRLERVYPPRKPSDGDEESLLVISVSEGEERLLRLAYPFIEDYERLRHCIGEHIEAYEIEALLARVVVELSINGHQWFSQAEYIEQVSKDHRLMRYFLFAAFLPISLVSPIFFLRFKRRYRALRRRSRSRTTPQTLGSFELPKTLKPE